MKIKVENELGYATFPITEDMIEIDEKELEGLGITKKFAYQIF